jgi:hypothetical protein
MKSNDFLNALVGTVDSYNDKKYSEYWSSLGQFIHIYAGVESRLVALLGKVSGTNSLISGILFSGTRTDAAKDHIYKILDETKDSSTKGRLEPALNQLAKINTIRNHLVHWEVVYNTEQRFSVSNKSLFPTLNKLKEFQITTKDIRDMITDLFKIHFVLSVEYFDYWNELSPDSRDGIRETWLYIPPQPSPRDTKSHRHPPISRHRQRASPESQPAQSASRKRSPS